MRQSYPLMGMTVSIEILDLSASREVFEKVKDYLVYVDEKFSTYKTTSEISAINRNEIEIKNANSDMKEIFTLAEKTKEETLGYFDIKKPDGSYDPSGLVKGWAIKNAADILSSYGYKNFFVDIGGDVEARGLNSEGEPWSIGIRSPFKPEEIVKVVCLNNRGIATSGTYERGQHIYNPHNFNELKDVVSLSVIAKNVYEADRYATAGFAMGRKGIHFIESVAGLEGYMIDKDSIGTETTGFRAYTKEA